MRNHSKHEGSTLDNMRGSDGLFRKCGRGKQTWALDAIYVKHSGDIVRILGSSMQSLGSVAAMTTIQLSHVQKIYQQLDGMVISLTISVTSWLPHPFLLANSLLLSGEIPE